MKRLRLALPLLLLIAVGCASPYKDALGRLSKVGRNVADKYGRYLLKEPDAATREASEAELTEFRKALDEAARAAGE